MGEEKKPYNLSAVINTFHIRAFNQTLGCTLLQISSTFQTSKDFQEYQGPTHINLGPVFFHFTAKLYFVLVFLLKS